MSQDAEEVQTEETTDLAVADEPGTVAKPDPLAQFGLAVPSAGTPVLPATRTHVVGGEVEFTLDVAYISRAEAFYQSFFEMDVVFRAWNRDGHWEATTEAIDWPSLMIYGEYPELVYLKRPGWSIILVSVGRGHVMTTPKLGDAEVPVAPDSLRRLRARALMKSYTVIEDTPTAFAFRDPYAVVWRLVADESLASQ